VIVPPQLTSGNGPLCDGGWGGHFSATTASGQSPSVVGGSSSNEEGTMAAIQNVARQFFEECEAGKGWAGGKAYCKPSATFLAQAEPLADVKTLEGYADWMQGMMKMMPDGHYDLKCWGVDPERSSIIAYATFIATHTGPGGPPPTGKTTRSDYVYCMAFD